MLRCSNCKGPVDRSAVSCPRCGRVDAGAEAARNSAIGTSAAILAIIGFLAYSWATTEPAGSRPPMPRSPVVAQATAQSTRKPTELGLAEEGVAPAAFQLPGNLASLQTPPDSSNAPGTRLERAVLKDTRGRIVLQSKASIVSKNVAVLAPGTEVSLEERRGNWVRVKTDGGLVGYVREKQLDFTPGAEPDP